MAERLESKLKSDDRLRSSFQDQNRERTDILKKPIPQIRKRQTKMLHENDRVEITIENLLKIAQRAQKIQND